MNYLLAAAREVIAAYRDFDGEHWSRLHAAMERLDREVRTEQDKQE